jgi:hypothetical protein
VGEKKEMEGEKVERMDSVLEEHVQGLKVGRRRFTCTAWDGGTIALSVRH